MCVCVCVLLGTPYKSGNSMEVCKDIFGGSSS